LAESIGTNQIPHHEIRDLLKSYSMGLISRRHVMACIEARGYSVSVPDVKPEKIVPEKVKSRFQILDIK